MIAGNTNKTQGKIGTGSGLKTDKVDKPNTPKKEPRKSGFLQKIASAGQKIGAGYQKLEKGIDTIHKLGTQGKLDLKGISQNILTKMLDRDTNKISLFGKKKFNKVQLGTKIVAAIRQYKGTVKQENFRASIVEIIRESGILYENNFCRLIESNTPTNRPSVKAVMYKFLTKRFNISGLYYNKVQVVNGKNVKKTHPIINYFSKNPVAILKKIKKIYPDIDLKFTPHSKQYGSSVKDINVKVHENTNQAVDVDTVVQNYKNPYTMDDFLKALGKENVIVLLGLIKLLFPGDRIRFPAQEAAVKAAKEAAEQKKKEDALKFVFTIESPKNIGDKGKQYTLITQDSDLKEFLNKKGIKYITYLIRNTDDNGLPINNVGKLFMYDNDNKIISELSFDAGFRWESKINGYYIGLNVEKSSDVKKSNGEIVVPKDDSSIVKVQNNTIIRKLDGHMYQVPIIRFDSVRNGYVINANKMKYIKKI